MQNGELPTDRVLDASERLDRVNDNIELIQRKDGLTFGTDALLLAAYIDSTAARALEIGGGTGIISLLTLVRGKFDAVDCCEVQKTFADIIERNARINGLDQRLSVKHGDVRELECEKQYDAVFTNPPYMKATSGKANENDGKNAARHEQNGDISDFCEAARRLLKFGGKFYAVYRPDRLTDLIAAMRNAKIEPKRLTFVHADKESEPSMLLVEGKMGGGTGLKITRPLIIYTDKAHKTECDDMKYILEFGSFPTDYSITNRGRKNG